ncbi:hypothetical protein HYDPIDRAFT_32571 [Hydnomerulius pinastri MD-312]|uniref:Unplaced genomic scaffold scaffold_42, whole genome shotgun sequence n=1 Tax=Hydnomerulius pinastri MD-312 TaxID=994086 RepID=A0A0C9W9X3_9AGAM|nr:hypothetical protein HYDPIDRAFT_32571 [Hydnomerulius pinastri MD-312]
MRGFTTISVLFTAALSVFTNASPVEVAKRQTPASVASILTDLTNTVTPLANQLLYATPDNATSDVLTPIIGSISSSVTDAVSSLNLLVGQPTSVIMASVDGTTTLDTTDISDLLSSVVNLILTAANSLLSVVDSTITSIITSLVSELGTLVFSLLGTVLSLVTGLLVPLLTLLAPILSIVSSLGLTSLLGDLLGGLLGGL